MNDRDFVMVTTNNPTIVVVLVGFWYKEMKVFDRVETIAESMPKSLLAGDFYDEPLGKAIIKQGDLVEEFKNFIQQNPLGSFAGNIAGSLYFSDLFIESRIALDLGRHLKKTRWWQDNLKELRSEQKKIRMIRDIQCD